MADVAASVQALFKEQYADKVETLIPEQDIIGKDAPFLTRKMEGKSYIMPVTVQNEQGFTYSAANAGVSTLNDSYGASVQRATITGQNVILRSTIAREDIDRGDSDMKAVEDTLDLVTANMLNSVTNRLEIARIHGNLSVGETDSTYVATAAVNDVTLRLTAASWSSGVWATQVGSLVQFIATESPTGTQQGGGTFTFRVKSFAIATRLLVVTAVGGVAATLVTNLNAANRFVFINEGVGAVGKEQYGLRYQLTTAGSVFGIDNTVYSAWAGNTYAVGAALSLNKILEANALQVGRGFMGDSTLYTSVDSFSSLSTTESGLRRYNTESEIKDAVNGSKSLKFYGQSGLITIKPHLFMKHSEAMLVPSKGLSRVGASDVKFVELNGDSNYMKGLEAKDGFELRVATNQAVFNRNPNHGVWLTTIS